MKTFILFTYIWNEEYFVTNIVLLLLDSDKCFLIRILTRQKSHAAEGRKINVCFQNSCMILTKSASLKNYMHNYRCTIYNVYNPIFYWVNHFSSFLFYTKDD